jgi:anti-sigma factor RsiW
MTCAKVKKSLPLLAGGDLTPRKERIVRAHINTCPSCRKELEEFRRELEGIKSAAQEERVEDWSEIEWKGLMARITAEKTGKRRRILGLRPRWAMASGLAAVIILAVTVLFFKNMAFGPKEISQRPAPDVVSVTMVSQETGLQVVWFFNKNFEWKGDKQ